MTNLFLNYNANTETLSINTFRNNGYYNENVVGLVVDIIDGDSSSCPLDGSLDAVRDGSLWQDNDETQEALEMVDNAICEFYWSEK